MTRQELFDTAVMGLANQTELANVEKGQGSNAT